MKLKVTLVFVVLLIAVTATAYADDFDPGTGAVIIDTPWTIGGLNAAIMAEVTADSAAATDVTSISIDAAASANSNDMEALDDYVNLQSLNVANTVTITETVDDFFLTHANIQSVIIYPDMSCLDYCFNDCDSLITLELHGAGVFDDHNIRYNDALTNLTLSNITVMDNNNIRDNTVLASLSLPNVIDIGNNCLRDMDALTSLSAPLLQIVGNNGIRNFDLLTTISLPAATSFGNGCLTANQAMTSLSLPQAVTFGNNCFRNNDAITSITLPEATTFGDECFSSSTLLATLSLPKADFIDFEAFEGNGALTSVSMPMIDTIGDDAFHNISYQVTMELGNTVPTGVTAATFSAYGPGAFASIVEVPILRVDDYDTADGSTDGLWFGWDIVGVEDPAPATNPQTGDSGVYIPFWLWLIFG